MVNVTLTQEIIRQIDNLPPNLQQKVLDFARSLSADTLPKGVPGKQLLPFAGTIPLDDLQIMADAIEAECEQVAIR